MCTCARAREAFPAFPCRIRCYRRDTTGGTRVAFTSCSRTRAAAAPAPPRPPSLLSLSLSSRSVCVLFCVVQQVACDVCEHVVGNFSHRYGTPGRRWRRRRKVAHLIRYHYRRVGGGILGPRSGDVSGRRTIPPMCSFPLFACFVSFLSFFFWWRFLSLSICERECEEWLPFASGRTSLGKCCRGCRRYRRLSELG